MRTTIRSWLAVAICLSGIAGCNAPAAASTLFCDRFTPAAKPDWGNERGLWRTAAHAYDATNPNNMPLTYTSVTTHTALANATVHVTVNNFNDGGIWMRSNYNSGAINGILLVTGGNTGTNNGFYWHVVKNGTAGAQLDNVSVPNIQGTRVSLKIVVKGNIYKLFVNGGKTPISTLVDSTYASGSIGLYDFSPTNGAASPRGETFSNFCISN